MKQIQVHLCQIKRRKINLVLIMVIIKIIELDAVFIILSVNKSLIIIVNAAVARKEDFASLNVNVQVLAQ
jgi:hypothetical protein